MGMAGLFQIDIKGAFDNFARAVDDIQRSNIPFVTARALTETAKDVRTAQVEGMRSVFDRPTRFTLNALQVVPATKQDLRAAVTFKSGFGSIPAERYLGPQVEGGGRHAKSHERALRAAGILRGDEYAVPGRGAVLDGSGNMKGGQLTQILSQLQASGDAMQNMTSRSRKRAVKKAGGRFFVLRGAGRAPDGVYRREGGRPSVPVLIFIKAPNYSKRLPFYEVAQDIVERRLPEHFARFWAQHGNQVKPT